jgi:hypothetical protein
MYHRIEERLRRSREDEMNGLSGVFAALLLVLSAGCTSANPAFRGDAPDEVPNDGASGDTVWDGAGADGDGSGADGDGTGVDGEGTGVDGDAAVDDAWGPLPDGGCLSVACQTHVYACGNCGDDDDDDRIDWADPDCLGPCDNNESGFFLDIPGGDSAPCKLDCYFDQDQGSGNDECMWDHRCDPLEPDHDPHCVYTSPPPPEAHCPETQTETCLEFCMERLTPNGCDCFGCCEVPGGSDNWVFIGTVDEAGVGTCTLRDAADHDLCHPCTPVESCLNPCGPYELCLGRTELPRECFPGGEDGGTDGGVPPGDRCAPEVQPCGLPGDAPCPPDYYCITGCCQPMLF